MSDQIVKYAVGEANNGRILALPQIIGRAASLETIKTLDPHGCRSRKVLVHGAGLDCNLNTVN